MEKTVYEYMGEIFFDQSEARDFFAKVNSFMLRDQLIEAFDVDVQEYTIEEWIKANSWNDVAVKFMVKALYKRAGDYHTALSEIKDEYNSTHNSDEAMEKMVYIANQALR